MTVDYLASVVSILCFNIFRHWWLYRYTDFTFAEWSRDLPVALGYVVFPLVMVAIYAVLGYYNDPVYKSRYELLSNALGASLIGSLVIYFTIMVNDDFHDRMLHYSFLLMLFVSLAVPVLIERFIGDMVLRRRIGKGTYAYNVLVVGSGRGVSEYADRLECSNASMGYKVVGIVSDEEPEDNPARPHFTFDELGDAVKRLNVKIFVVYSPNGESSDVVKYVRRLYDYGIGILVPLLHYNLITARPKLMNVVGEPLVDVSSPGMTPCMSNLKRICDVVVSAVVLVLILPLLVILALLIKLDSKGPVFYTQERVGLHRKPFKIIKLRSMIVNSEPNGPALSSAEDRRVTRLGRVMRKYRLDELPQFWNVLRGDMSLVGPRPEREYYLSQLRKIEPAISNIHSIRPGITSLGSVKYGYAGNIDEMVNRIYFDMLYLENMSPAMDLKILFHTVVTVVTGKGV